MTWDIDWVLSGPYNPKKVKELLSWITDIGWAHKIYPDVVYSELLFDVIDASLISLPILKLPMKLSTISFNFSNFFTIKS